MFGKTLMLDMYDCADGVCDDMELHYRFLEELVVRLKMEAMTTPIVVHCPLDMQLQEVYMLGQQGNRPYHTFVSKKEKYPDKRGCSGWIGLTTSGCQVHSIEPSHFSALDIFTCGELDVESAIKFAKEIFKFNREEHYVIERGVKYDCNY